MKSHAVSRMRGRRTNHELFRRRKSDRSLRFEPLEARRLLAITVDTLVDEADGSIVDGDISLRDAIDAAARRDNRFRRHRHDHAHARRAVNRQGAHDHRPWRKPAHDRRRRQFARLQYRRPGQRQRSARRDHRFDRHRRQRGVQAGGGIRNREALTLDRVAVSGNSATNGGGIDSRQGSLTLRNSTVSANQATSDGGFANVFFSTITDSTAAANRGSGLAIAGLGTGAAIGHSILADNTGSDVDVVDGGNPANILSQGYNLVGGGNAAFRFGGAGDTTGQSAMLGALANNGGPTRTQAPSGGSLAIDSGNPSLAAGVGGVPLFDQRGEPFTRVADGDGAGGARIDIGAYEVQSLALMVDTLTDESDGVYSADDLSLREALVLTNANPGTDEITFDASLAGGTIDLALGQLTINGDLVLTGLGADQLTIDAQGDSRVMFVTGTTTAEISGLTLTGGVMGQGGGLFNNTNATTTLLDVTIEGNTATVGIFGAGGGVWNGGNLTITLSSISGNTATAAGGGIFNYYQGALTITGSTISGNMAGAHGGGIRNSGDLAITDSTISGNMAGSDGGGIHNSGDLSITGSSLSGNMAGRGGGGVYGRFTIADTTISGNMAGEDGGGVWNLLLGQISTITNSTISGNTANSEGGGVYSTTIIQGGLLLIEYSTITSNTAPSGGGAWASPTSSPSVAIRSSIIAGNTSGDDVYFFAGTNPFQSNGYNLIGTGNATGAFNQPGDQVGANPMLGPLADNGGPTQTHALLAGSPALDAGDPAAVPGVGVIPLFDQRGVGFPRVVNGRIDIGAFELALPGDYNRSGAVGAADYVLWRKMLGDTGVTPFSGADGDGDGDITSNDYDVWTTNFGDLLPPPGAGSGAVEVGQAAPDDSLAIASQARPDLRGVEEPAATTTSFAEPQIVPRDRFTFERTSSSRTTRPVLAVADRFAPLQRSQLDLLLTNSSAAIAIDDAPDSRPVRSRASSRAVEPVAIDDAFETLDDWLL